jgi:hypothetical protein
MGFHFSKAGELIIDGWKQVEYRVFLQPELVETYVQALRNQLQKRI